MGFDVKITTKISILDLLMPYTCRGCGRLGDILCERCKKYIISSEIRDGWIYAVGRREGVLMKITEEYKYKSIRKTSEVLAELLDAVLPEKFKGKEVVLVPLPTISRHIRERGFDHTLRLAKALSRRRDFQVNSLLLRVNKTVQVGADAKTRKAQAKKAYSLSPEATKIMGRNSNKLPADKVYLLLDDVSTTGASLQAARDLLKKAGAKEVFATVVCVGLND